MQTAPTATGRRKPPLASKEELVAIAIDYFAIHGYQGTTIDKIARAAGVTKGALYYHFRDKEDLLFQAVRDRVADFERRVVQVVVPVEDSTGALRQIIDSCLYVATRNNHRRFLLTLMVEAIDNYPELSEQFRQMMQRFRTFIAGIVRTGQERKIFRFDIEPEAAANVFIAGIMGAEIQYYQDSERIDLERVVGDVLDGFISWLAVRQGNETEPASENVR